MSAKASALMKTAQVEKTKQTTEQLVHWYSKKEEFFKRYVPIQESLIKKTLNAPEITLNRLKEISQIVAEEKELQAFIFEKTQKALLTDETRFTPKVEEKVNPQDPKGTSKISQELPTWSNNIDRVLLSMSRTFKQRKTKVKQVYKLLDSIHSQLLKQQQRYRLQIRKEQRELQKLFDRFDECQKEQSKSLAKILKQIKNDNFKDSSFFIGEIKCIEKHLHGEFDCFVERNKIVVKLIQAIIKNEKIASKKIKEQLTLFLNYRRENMGKETKGEEEIWGFLSIAEERIEEERLKYFNAMLLKPERIELLKAILDKLEFKNSWQVIVKFIEMSKVDLMKPISANEEIGKLLKNISYRCWQGVSLAQGWLIESYTPAVVYMTYDYIIIIYSLEGDLLKKINTNSSKVKQTQGQTLFLEQKQKGFFSDSIEQYKLKFQDIQRMQEFQLFIENQVK